MSEHAQNQLQSSCPDRRIDKLILENDLDVDMLHENAIQDRDRPTPTTETSDVGGGNSGVDDDPDLFTPSSTASHSSRAVTDATSKARASWGSSNDARSENHEHPTAASPEGNGSSGSSSQERCVATADGNSPRHQTAPAPENFRKRSYSDGEVDGIAHGRESEGLAGRKRHRSRTLLRYLNSLGCDDPWSAYNQRFDSTDDAKSLEDAMEPEL